MPDSAFTEYAVEDVMKEAGILLQPLRKKNSKRPVPPYVTYLQARGQKMVETTGSLIERLLPPLWQDRCRPTESVNCQLRG